MNKKVLLAPVILRYLFFFFNLYFTIKIVSLSGWGFFSIILASFAARDIVQATQLAQIYYQVTKQMDNKK